MYTVYHANNVDYNDFDVNNVHNDDEVHIDVNGDHLRMIRVIRT